METIHIYHTNDLHSHFGHWPRINNLLQTRKTIHAESEEEVYIFDIGDHLDRWHPLADGTRGKGNCELLNSTGYTAVTIGNNEGITLAGEDLDHMYDKAKFPVLVANLYNADGTRPRWAKPYEVYETKHGTKIAVIGVTVYFAHFYKMLGWELTDPIDELRRQLRKLKGKTDIIILLSHLGIHDDEKIAGQFPEIDLILGGHTHHILHQGKEIGRTLLGAAGKHGMYVGHITLKVDSTKQLINKKAILYDTNKLKPVAEEELIIQNLYRKGKDILNVKVVELPENLEARHFQDSKLASILCKAMKEWCEADCAFLNAGLLLKDLPKGIVTEYDLLTTCPHPINPCVVELTGAELKEVLLQTLDEEWPHMQIKGLGFRGTVMGRIIYNGVEISQQSSKGRTIIIEGEPLNSKKVYKLAIPDMFTFGRFFPEISRAAKNYYLPEFLRDILKWELQRLYN